MKTKMPFFYVLLFCFCSCHSGKHTEEVKHIANPEYTVISDSIYSNMPGSIFYQEGILYWHDVFSSGSFIHALDVKTKKEIQSFGHMGNGPEEFSTPLLSLSPSGGLLINDARKGLEILYQTDRKTDSLRTSVREYENKPMATRLLYLKTNELLYVCPAEKKPFYIKYGDAEGVYGGVQPIAGEIANGFDVFQGQIAYNPHRDALAFCAFGFISRI